MMRAFSGIGVAALLSSAVFAQSTQTAPAFDVADVHVRALTRNPSPFPSGGVLRGGRYDLRNATMLDLIRAAYDVDPDTVVGGPIWLERDRFDVIAKAPPSTSPAIVREMLQALLAERFKLVIRRETRPMPGYALTVAKGKSKLKEASGQGLPGCQFEPQNPAAGVLPYVMFSCRNITMEAFAQNLRGIAGTYLSNPVIDQTGLKGSWDFDIKLTTQQRLAQAGADGITIFDAVEQQLGLKLEAQKVPTPVILVDSVNQRPTGNPAEVTQNLPPAPPAEFEVADIKLSMPDANPMGRLQPGGRIDLQGFTLKMLITLAWDINDDQMLVGAPKWLDSTRFNVLAKTSSVAGPANAPQIDIDDVRLMLRALLVERFKLATHTEERPVSAYTLVAVKPKLQKADPLNRTRWKEGPAPDSKDPRTTTPILSRLITCQNMTMAQFAEDLQRMAGGYIHSPVEDATGIEGAWDFTLSFTPAGLLRTPGGRGGDGGQPAAGVPTASDPTGGLSLFDALNKQLGLKLETHNRTMPVLVIDHVEEKPTDN
jgi:uncharacterized protein (TIGR03435 family)